MSSWHIGFNAATQEKPFQVDKPMPESQTNLCWYESRKLVELAPRHLGQLVYRANEARADAIDSNTVRGKIQSHGSGHAL
jgi:hypothetical protein